MEAERTSLPLASKSTRVRRSLVINYDLVLLFILALLLPTLVLLPLPLVRVPIGLVMVLLVPGYVLEEALFAREDDLDGPVRAALSFGLSVAVIPLLALVLDALPWGIRLWPMVIALSSWIVVCGGVAAARRYLLGPAAVTRPLPWLDPRTWWRGLGRRQRLAYSAGALAAIALLISGVAALLVPDPSTRMTEFYALGAEGRAEDYPREVAPGEQMQVRLGVTNREGITMTYRVEVRSGQQLLAEVKPFTLAAGTTWEMPIHYALSLAGEDQGIDIFLFQNADHEPYRRLRLWVNVRNNSSGGGAG